MKTKLKKIPIKTYDAKKRKDVFVGYLTDNGFIRRVTKKHYMVIEKGYGLQNEVLSQLYNAQCDRIVLLGKNFKYESTLNQWLSSPITNYGHGLQRFLEVDKMRKI